jgi:hypothetical protein
MGAKRGAGGASSATGYLSERGRPVFALARKGEVVRTDEKARPAFSGNSGKSGGGGAAVIHQDKGGDDVFNTGKRGFICNSCNND